MHTTSATPARATSPDIDGDEGFVVLVRSPIEPHEVEDHLARVTQAIENYIGSLPGYISGNLHVRLDEREFLNYTEWKTEEHYDAFIASLEEGRGKEVLENVRYKPDLIRYRYHETLLPETGPGGGSSMSFAAVERTEVGPRNAKDVFQKIRQNVLEDIRYRPGFISASLHIRLDDTEVMNYTEWESEGYYDAFLDTVEVSDGSVQMVDKFTRVRTFGVSKSK